MKLVKKHQQLTKSLKFISSYPDNENKISAHNPMRSSMDEKIQQLKTPVYSKKKILRKNFLAISIEVDKQKPKITNTHRRTESGNCFTRMQHN